MSKGKRGTRKVKNNNSKRIEEVISDDSTLMDKFFIVAAVILFLLCFYILTVYITNKNSDETKEEEKTVEISKDEIVLGSSLSMKGDYYVIYYNKGNDTIEEIIKNYGGELSLYKVDMSNAFNKKYATSEESNKSPSKVSEFKINGPTLIKVSNKKVVNYIEGEDEIRTILN